MTQHSEAMQGISTIIKSVGESLQAKPSNVRLLKILWDRVATYSMRFEDQDIAFLGYFLSTLTEDIWFNLMSDASSEINLKVREKFVEDLGTKLVGLSGAFANPDTDAASQRSKLYSLYSEIGSLYWNLLPRIEPQPVKDVKLEPTIPRTPLVEALSRSPVAKCSDHSLTSGVPSKHHIDMDYLLQNMSPKTIGEVSGQYAAEISKLEERGVKIDKLAFFEKPFGPIGPFLFVSSIVEKTNKPAVLIRLKRRTGIEVVKGAELKRGDSVLIVSDIATSGEGIDQAAEVLRRHGAAVTHALVLVNRNQGAKEALKLLADIELVSAFDSEALGYPPGQPTIGPIKTLSRLTNGERSRLEREIGAEQLKKLQSYVFEY